MDGKISLQASMRPLVWMSKLYGVFPFATTVTRTRDVEISNFGIFHGVCLTIICSLLKYLHRFHVEDFDAIEQFVFETDAVFNIILSLVSLLSYMVHVGSNQVIFRSVYSTSGVVKSRSFYKKATRVLLAQLLLLYFIMISHHVNSYFMFPANFLSWVFEIVLDHVLSYSNTLISLQFANLLLYFSYILCVFHDELLKLPVNSRFSVANSGVNRLVRKRKEPEVTREEMDVDVLVGKYNDVLEVCNRANESFGVSNTAISVKIFIQILICWYYFMVVDIGGFEYIFVQWFAFHFLQLWIMLFSCEYFIKQTKRTGVIVHNLMAQTKDQRLKEQLQQFSIQLLHRKVKFTACGLFPLNYTLIYSIAGAVTTYLVILIQFQNTSNKATTGTTLGLCNVTEYNRTMTE